MRLQTLLLAAFLAGVCGVTQVADIRLVSEGPPYDGKVRDSGDGSSEAYMIPPYLSNHASTLEQLPDGTLVAAWFSGAHEEASGCAIVVARLPANSSQWSKAATVSKRDGYSNQNPVLFFDTRSGVLHLYHSQAKAESGESESQIWHLRSTDHGHTWNEPAAWLKTAGSFPRNRIIPASDGGVIFPFYSATNDNKKFDRKNYARMGFSGHQRNMDDSSSWTFMDVNDSQDLVQPSTVFAHGNTSGNSLLTFFRDRNHQHIYSSRSSDDGKTWSKPQATVLPNNNAGIEAYNLEVGEEAGNIVLCFNPQCSGRDPLSVGISSKDGQSWPYQRYLQHGQSTTSSSNGNEFSYPTVLQTPDGQIHAMFTYLRETIKYMRFDASWVKKGNPPTPSGKWSLAANEDACPNGDGCSMVGTTPSLETCLASCSSAPGCTIFDWNSRSGHCYHRSDGKWNPKPNPRVTSGCLESVSGCPTPKWSMVANEDACPNGDGCSLNGTTPSLETCLASCKSDPSCTIFDWNSHSGHCYHRSDRKWDPKPNSHVTSGCLESVPGCPTTL